MSVDAPERKFPSCFPADFEEKILPQGLPDIELDVFRVCTTGIICKETFLSTYEEIDRGLKPTPHNWERKKKRPGTYSVSCNDTLEGASHALACLTDYHPEAFLVCGRASSEMGPMQRSKDRQPGYQDETHFDWWLYADSDPSPRFKPVKNREGEAPLLPV